jgi:hypothetical protein
MLMRLASVIPVFLLLSCVSPAQQAGQQAAAAAIHAGEPIAGNAQAREALWSVRFADENQCTIKGYQAGTQAFVQCVRTTIEEQSRPHRCTYCRSLD